MQYKPHRQQLCESRQSASLRQWSLLICSKIFFFQYSCSLFTKRYNDLAKHHRLHASTKRFDSFTFSTSAWITMHEIVWNVIKYLLILQHSPLQQKLFFSTRLINWVVSLNFYIFELFITFFHEFRAASLVFRNMFFSPLFCCYFTGTQHTLEPA